jgi:hypothetical protein
VAVEPAGQLKFSVFAAIVYGELRLVVPLTFVASNSLIAPYAPDRETVKEPALVVGMVRVSVCRVVNSVVSVTLKRHCAGAVSVPVQPSTTANGGELVRVAGPLKVTEPFVMLTVTLCAALVGGVTGVGVIVGMPKEREGGETETVCAKEFCGARPSTKRRRAKIQAGLQNVFI